MNDVRFVFKWFYTSVAAHWLLVLHFNSSLSQKPCSTTDAKGTQLSCRIQELLRFDQDPTPIWALRSRAQGGLLFVV